MEKGENKIMIIFLNSEGRLILIFQDLVARENYCREINFVCSYFILSIINNERNRCKNIVSYFRLELN